MKRWVPPPSSLTSLLDVLFILVFAALVQLAARQAPAEAAAAPPPPTPPPAPLANAALRQAAIAATTKQLAGAPLLVARIAADGTLAALERDGDRRALPVPLLAAIADPDVGVAYVGDRAPAQRVCALVAAGFGLPTLRDAVVAIAPDAPRAALPVALVAGLERDAERCHPEQHALALVLYPEATP